MQFIKCDIKTRVILITLSFKYQVHSEKGALANQNHNESIPWAFYMIKNK